VADAMASNRMDEARYKYVVIDDCWQVSRDESVPDPARFGTVASHAVVMVKITP
jgi:alpha-galactosidase